MTVTTAQGFDRKSALAFVVAFGFVSLFADAAYEGMRGISGPFLALLGASGAAVGIIAGGGELIGYLLRLVSGRLAERTHAYWTLTIGGYAVQMAAVPLLAFAASWQAAALLIVLERAGKALRKPTVSFMLSRAGSHIGQGWAFGLHEAMDQAGAMGGPLIAALVLAGHGDYRTAFLWLGVPAALTVVTVLGVRARHGHAGHLARPAGTGTAPYWSRAFKLYAIAAALIGFGFVDYPLIAFHFARAAVLSPASIPVFYALAMGAAGLSALAFGRWYDTSGLKVLVPGLVIGALVTPLAFLGGAALGLAGVLLWGAALGIHETVMDAAIAGFVPQEGRAQAFGAFSALYGIAWFAGSALAGELYDHSIIAMVAVSMAATLGAIIPLTRAMKALRTSSPH
jgi:predicted MFS family arabinose efflux permease